MAYDSHSSQLISNPPLRVTGYCIFVDIVGSTCLKDRPIQEWATWFRNTFINAMCCMGWHNEPFKIIGDCAMFFISETELSDKGGHALSIFVSMCDVARNVEDDRYSDVKISVCFC